MADLAQYVFGVGGTQLDFSGTINREGDRVHLVAELDWTPFLDWGFSGDPVWLAIPRSHFDAADNPQFLGDLPGYGLVMLAYAGPDDPFSFPTPYYQGTWISNGDDEAGGKLMRNECYLFLDVFDEAISGAGVPIHSDIDLSWPAGSGGAGQLGPQGSITAGNSPRGGVRSLDLRPSGRTGVGPQL